MRESIGYWFFNLLDNRPVWIVADSKNEAKAKLQDIHNHNKFKPFTYQKVIAWENNKNH